MEPLFVERIEGDYAILISESEPFEEIRLPRYLLPDVCEGEWITFTIEKDTQTRNMMNKRIHDLISKIKKN